MTDDQFAQIVGLLTEIRDVLTFIATPQEEPGCEHPEDQRVDLGGMGREEWICKVCRSHFKDGAFLS